MKQSKSITITAAIAALVIFASISFSGASQTYAKYRVQGKHKHALVKVKSERAVSYTANDGILGGTGSPLDTVAILGPFDRGARTMGLVVSAANPNIYFAIAPSGGVWKSTNMGAFWLPVDTPTVQAAYGICENPLNPNIFYFTDGSVYKSTDGGNTFSATSGHAGQYIACDQADANTVYSGVGGTTYGLQRSTDNGSTWSMAGGTSGGAIDDILALPSGAVLIAKKDSGIYRATNGKTGSFTKITSAAFPANVYDIEFANCKSFPNVIYVAFYYSGTTEVLCKSSDGGVTWTARTFPTSVGNVGEGYHIGFGVSNTDTNRVLVGIVSSEYSTDGGTTWNNAALNHWDYRSYANFPGSSNKFIHGGDDGIGTDNWGRGTNGVDSISYWNNDTDLANNYVITQFEGGDFASSGRRCIGGTFDNGSWRLRPTDPGTNVNYSDGFFAHISQQDSNTAYSTDQGSLYRSTNFFSATNPSWTTISPPGGWGWANAYQINYADGQQLYAHSAQAIWRTTNAGSSWTQLNSANIPGINYIGCTAVTNPTIYFGSYDGTHRHFYRIDTAQTAPANGTPVDLSATLGNTVDPMGEISPYPTNPTTLYIGFQGSSTNSHAWKVLNANTATPTWVNISGTGTHLPTGQIVYQIQADPLDTTTLLAATNSGLYFSTDNGADWYKETRIPTKVAIKEMQLRASDRKLFLFTWGRGVWYASIHFNGKIGGVQQASVEPTPATPQLQFSLYPNPATEKLTINPQQELSSSARIAIYSSDGRMISESAWNPTGGEGQEVNIRSLPSGVYFLQITDGNRIAKNKFVKM